MNYLFKAIALLFIVASCSSASVIQKSDSYLDNPVRPSLTKNFDVVHSDISIEPIWKDYTLKGDIKLTLKPHFYPSDSIVLDAQYMDIYEVEILQPIIPYKHHYDSSHLHIKLGKELTRYDSVIVRITYRANPERVPNLSGAAIVDNKGVYFIEPDSTEDFPEHIWTQGETKSSSCWFPTIDDPQQKMTQSIALKVDTQYTTLSNGLLDSSVINGAKRIDYWSQMKPHSPYLVMFFVGPYDKYTDHWVNSKGDTLAVDYYMEPQFSAIAHDVFGNTPEMLSFFSDRLGYEFAWDKYAQVVVREFVAGAMENTSASIFYDALNATSESLIEGNHDDIIAHELFHQWFGNVVTCESWANLPLNESFATYGEYLWREYKYGKDEADYLMMIYESDYYSESKMKQVPLIRYRHDKSDDMFDAHSYQKGGKVLHMLRYKIGDDAFFTALSNYLNKYAFKTVEIHQLRLEFEAVTGFDLKQFFDEWFMTEGHAEVKVDYIKESDKAYIVSFDQKDEMEYHISVPIYIKTKEGYENRTVELAPNNSLFRLEASAEIEFISIDPHQTILWKLKDNKPNEFWKLEAVNGIAGITRNNALQHLDSSLLDASEKQKIWIEASEDPFWLNRELSLEKLDLKVDASESIIQLLMNKVKSDSNVNVRYVALEKLASLEDKSKFEEFKSLALTVLKEDSSLTVKSGALYLLNALDKELASKEAIKFIDEDNLNMNFTLAEIFAGSEVANEKVTAFYANCINNAYKYYKWQYVYYFSMYVKKPNFNKLEWVNGVLDFTVKYQNDNFKMPYTRYLTGQLLEGVEHQYNLLIKNEELSEQDKSTIQSNLARIAQIKSAIKEKT